MRIRIIFLLFLLIALMGCDRFLRSRTELLTLNYDPLLEVKKGIREKSPEYLVAYQWLLKEADNAMNHSCYSVTHKQGIPPSGDKKDYMSLATYWWPDPEQPDGLPYIRKDGYRNPEGDGEFYDDVRSSNMVDDISTLTLAWFYSGNADYASKAAEMIEVWFIDPETSMNPNLQFGQAIPGRVDGRGIGIIDTRNYVNVIDAVKLLQGSQAWKSRDTKKLKQWFSAYFDWLVNSDYGIDEKEHENNHGSWYDVQVSCYADFIGKTDMVKEILAESATLRIDQQIDALGKQKHELSRTRAFNYSVMNLQALMLLGKMGEVHGVDLWNYESPEAGSIRKGCNFIFSFITDFEEWPYQQITRFDLSAMIPLLSECSRIYKDPVYDQYLGIVMNKINSTDRLILTKL